MFNPGPVVWQAAWSLTNGVGSLGLMSVVTGMPLVIIVTTTSVSVLEVFVEGKRGSEKEENVD